jgi:beta-galactosidase
VFVEVARATGEVDANRLPKEGYFASKAMWSEEPQVHIIGHWNYTATTTKDVNVVSNCDAVELFVNGISLGRNATPTNTYLFVFRGVRWASGTIRAVGYRGTTMAAEQEKTTAGDPFQLRLTATTGPDGFRADGSDVAIVDVEVLDQSGNRCPTDQARVDFTISGPGVWRGGYNSGKANSTNNTYLDTECGINRVFVRSTATAGDVTVSASRAGLVPASVKIASMAVQLSDGLSRTMPAVYP